MNKTMIVDTLDNAARYFMLHPSLEQAFDFLEEVNAEDFPEGKQELVGEHLFANGMKRSTKDYNDCIWEAHEQYLDIHFLAEGEERIFYAPEDSMKEVKAYDAEKDITVFEGEGYEVLVPKGAFVIFFPGEIHKALVKKEEAMEVKKMVVKLQLG